MEVDEVLDISPEEVEDVDAEMRECAFLFSRNLRNIFGEKFEESSEGMILRTSESTKEIRVVVQGKKTRVMYRTKGKKTIFGFLIGKKFLEVMKKSENLKTFLRDNIDPDIDVLTEKVQLLALDVDMNGV